MNSSSEVDMNEPRTEAGRQFADAIHGLAKPGSFGDLALLHPRDAIQAVEDEARADLLTTLEAEVGRLAPDTMEGLTVKRQVRALLAKHREEPKGLSGGEG